MKGSLYRAHLQATATKAHGVISSLSWLEASAHRRRSVYIVTTLRYEPTLCAAKSKLWVSCRLSSDELRWRMCMLSAPSCLTWRSYVAKLLPWWPAGLRELFKARNVASRSFEPPELDVDDQLHPPVPLPQIRTMARWSGRIRWWDIPVDSWREWRRTFNDKDTLLRRTNRMHGSVTFHLFQFLTGHGCFNHYLHGMGHAPSPG